MYPVILRLGRLSIYSYGLMMAPGFLVAGFLLKKELKRVGLSVDMGDLIVIGAVLGGIIGAKFYSLMQNLNDPNALSLKSIFSGSGLVLAIPLAVLGLLHPVIAEAAMASSSVSVVTNANRLRKVDIRPDYSKTGQT